MGIEDLGLSLRLYGNSCSKLSGKRPNKVTDVEFLWRGGVEGLVFQIEGHGKALYEWLSKLWSLLGTLNNGCRAILGTQKGTIILTTTHMHIGLWHCRLTVLPLEMVIAPSK